MTEIQQMLDGDVSAKSVIGQNRIGLKQRVMMVDQHGRDALFNHVSDIGRTDMRQD
ncbi:hypothetical protein D3C76_1777290 [compost metagenome]